MSSEVLVIPMSEQHLRVIMREEMQGPGLVLTEKEMEGITVKKALAAEWIGVDPKTINAWQKEKKIVVEKNNRIALVEVVRHMKIRAVGK